MDNRFLMIGIIVVIIVVTLLIWQYRRRHRRRSKMAERPENDLYAERYFDDHPLEIPSEDKPDTLFETEPPLVEDTVEVPTSELPEPETVTASTPPQQSELIIVLYVVAQHEPGFLGTDIFTVLEDLGLKYGEMNIFHHYGVGDIKVKQPVFSLANMVEPGFFEPHNLSEFASPGLALFMRLPGPFGGRVAFELMLNNAQKIAEILEGLLEDDQHVPLDQNKISALREKIAHFEQRSTSLSMLKRFN